METINFLTQEEQSKIIDAIQKAERVTSGEIKIHIESSFGNTDIMERAMDIFDSLNLHLTARKNGILFYVAVKDRKFAILGDSGINTVVPLTYWDDLVVQVSAFFKQGRFADGLLFGIQICGQKLAEKFPYQNDDINELSDEISFGE